MKEINLEAPMTWDELSKKQLLRLCKLWTLNLDKWTFLVATFCLLSKVNLLTRTWHTKKTNVNLFEFRHKRTRFVLNKMQVHSFVKRFEFLMKDCDLTKQLIPSFRFRLKKYYGPDDCLFNISWLEFIHCEAAYYNYNKSKNLEYLNKLVAILYRPKQKWIKKLSPKFTGDVRERFNDYTYQYRTKLFAKLPHYKQIAIFFFYAGSKKYIMSNFPETFSSSKQEGNGNVMHGFHVLTSRLNSGDVTKNKQIYDTQAWEVLQQVENMILQNQKKKHV